MPINGIKFSKNSRNIRATLKNFQEKGLDSLVVGTCKEFLDVDFKRLHICINMLSCVLYV